MKKYIIFALIIILNGIPTLAQVSLCRNDSLKIQAQEYRGDLLWQKSQNGTDWTAMEGTTSASIELLALESAYYRYELTEGTCTPIYSDILEIIVNPLPVVSMTSLDSLCVNDEPIQLQNGTPAGGTYLGPGIVDGRFIPAMAGTGNHTLYYRMEDEVTTCKDSASALIKVLPLPSESNAGEDLPEIIEDSVQLSAVQPTEGEGYWSVISGEGGYFSDSTNPNAWFRKGLEGTYYTLQWNVINTCGTSQDEVNLTFLRLSANPCPGTPVVYDADGRMYPTILIGTQCWMAENLKVGITVTSTEDDKAHSNASDNGIIERYVMDNNEANIDIYGGLYDWDEMMAYSSDAGGQGICPEGWHVPTLEEYDKLENFFESDPGLHLKEGGNSGFEGQLAGDRHSQGFFVSFGSSGFFWTSTTWHYDNENEGWVRELCACNTNLDKVHFSKKTGASVRCLKDE